MKKLFLFFSFSFLVFHSHAQTWYDLNGGFTQGGQYDKVDALCNDTLHNVLWAGGRFTETTAGDTVNNLAIWDGSFWHPFKWYQGAGTVIGYGTSSTLEVTSLIQYDSLIALGAKYIGATGGSVALLNKEDSTTIPLGNFDADVNTLCIYNDTLYAAGGFSTYQHPGLGNPWIPMNGIAKWNGTDFVPVGNIGMSSGYEINAMCVYNNSLVVGGLFEYMDGVYCKNVAQWDGIYWSAIGAGIGIMGDLTDYILSLASFNGKIYAGGGAISQ